MKEKNEKHNIANFESSYNIGSCVYNHLGRSLNAPNIEARWDKAFILSDDGGHEWWSCEGKMSEHHCLQCLQCICKSIVFFATVCLAILVQIFPLGLKPHPSQVRHQSKRFYVNTLHLGKTFRSASFMSIF